MSSTSSPENDTKPYVLNIQNVLLVCKGNGTCILNPNPDPVLEIAKLVALGILFLVSLCGNTFLLVTITSSYTLRSESFNMLLANGCVMFLIETTVNISIALLCISTDKLDLGRTGCAISSFMIQIVTMEVTFMLSMMSLQIMIVMKNPYEFQSFWTSRKQIVAIVMFWAVGILLCLPLLLESIQSEVFLPRYGCAFTGYDGFVYMLFVTIWCYGVMIVVGVGCLVKIAVQQYKEYKEEARKHGMNYSEFFIPGSLWTEWTNVKLVSWLTLFYFLLELPYILMHQITGLKYDSNRDAQDTSLKHESVFTWFRYLYSCFFFCVVFKIRKDIRSKFRNLLPCCRPNVVRDQSPIPTVKPETKKKGQRKDSLPPINLSTPVLYISPEGLCLRQLAPPSKAFLNYTQSTKLNKTPNFISYLCDVEPVSVTEDFSESLDDSFRSASRRSSRESEISLTGLNNSDTLKNASQEVPLKDIDSKLFESPAKSNTPPQPQPSTPTQTCRKRVRFSDTVTFYRSATPELDTPTPHWVTPSSALQNMQTKNKYLKLPMSRHSKIPMRVQPAKSTPWKVDLDTTYSITTPFRKGNHATPTGLKDTSEFRTIRY